MKERTKGTGFIKRFAWCLKCNRFYRVRLLNHGNHWCDMDTKVIPNHIKK